MAMEDPRADGSLFDAAALESVLMRFEAAWKGDATPLMDEYLTGTGPSRSQVLRELIYVDLECRLTSGEPVRVEAYLRCYPELADDIPFCLDLLAREFYFRQRIEPQLGFAEYEQRFPKFGSELRKVVAKIVPRSRPGRISRFSARLNCPHCHNPIEIVAESAQEEVVCPSCGSSMKLDGGQTLTWDKQRLPHIDQFELLEAVGRGAFGTVYKARDSQLQRLVAIKIPRSGVLATDEDEDRFVREARNAAQLQHPGIVTVFSVGRTETFPYLISEFVDGVTLAQYLTAKRFTMREAAKLTQDIALGLQHAHEHGVTHRDLKPSNIMLTPGGQPRIMDFGFAKRDAGEITMTLDGQVLGTPAYMSPEQARGQAHNADARSDIYSIGVILFQLLTGELPFRGDVRMLLHQVIHDEPPHPRRLNDKIPRDLDTICLKCMAKEPQRRYATAHELADDVERFLTGQPILARPVGRIERTWRWCRRNPTVAGLSSVAILLLLLTAFVMSVAYVRESQLANRYALLADENSKLAEQEKSAREKAGKNADVARLQTNLSKRHLYMAHMNLAQVAWDSIRVGETKRLLDLYAPKVGYRDTSIELRGFEWSYWDHLCHSELLTLKSHAGKVWSVAFSPDGKWLASASDDQTVKVWDAISGNERHTLKGHTADVKTVTFSPDGNRLVSASDDRVVKVWDIITGKESLALNGHSDGVKCVSFSPDGKRLASASGDRMVGVWDVTSGKVTLSLHGHTTAVNSVAFSPDGKWLASASGGPELGEVIIWDSTSGKETLALKGKNYDVLNLAISPDGKWLVTAHEGRDLKVWNTTTGEETLTCKGHVGSVNCVAISSDGKRLASASDDHTVKVWDAASGQEMFTLSGHTGIVTSVAFSPDGRRLVSGGGDQTVKKWDATNGQRTRTHKIRHFTPAGLAFSTDGKSLALANSDIKDWRLFGEVTVRDVTTGQVKIVIKRHTNEITCVIFSPDGKRLASASKDQTVRMWDATNGKEVLTLKGHVGSVNGVAFSPDGKRLVSASSDRTVKLWDAASGKEILALKGHIGSVTCAVFRPDGKQLASASDDQSVLVWDATTGQKLLTLNSHTDGVTSLAFGADGKKLASASRDHTVKVWDATSGREVLTLKGHIACVNRVVFSPDGQRLASASDDRTVKVWDAITGQESLTLNDHSAAVKCIEFSSDGKLLASASMDQSVKVWDGRPWTPELRAELEAVSLIHFLRDQGKPQVEWLAAIGTDQTISELVRQRALQFARGWK